MAAQRAQRTADAAAGFYCAASERRRRRRRALERGERAAPLPRRCVLKLAGDQDVHGEVGPPMRSLLQRDVAEEREETQIGGMALAPARSLWLRMGNRSLFTVDGDVSAFGVADLALKLCKCSQKTAVNRDGRPIVLAAGV